MVEHLKCCHFVNQELNQHVLQKYFFFKYHHNYLNAIAINHFFDKWESLDLSYEKYLPKSLSASHSSAFPSFVCTFSLGGA